MKRSAICRTAARTCVVAGIVCCLASAAHAQANRGTTTSGAFGQTNLGGTSGASPQGLGSGMTTGMSSNATQGGSGANNNTGAGNSAFGQATDATGMQQLQRGGETGFVGLSASSVQNPFASGQAGRGNQNFNSLTQLLTRSRQNQFNRQQAQQSNRGNSQARSQFRVPLRIGFVPTGIGDQQLGSQFAARLTKIPGLSQLGPITVTLEGQTAVLQGTVATEADRQLAEGLARLEPEIQAIRNELVVVAPGTTAEALPPGQ